MQRVECIQVRHSYDGVRDAVSNLTLSIAGGEVLALIGPNGAGKSTTLRVFATLQKPDFGTVAWDGADAWENRYEVRRRIGFLGDGTALYPTMTAAEYLGFFADCYGLVGDAARRKVAELLMVFGLSAKADARISDLSKGMRQRLAIARTMVSDPELLLLDEPADGLDPRARRQLRDILREVASRGVGIVVSSHILRELDGFCDTVALIQKGKLEVHGTVDEIIARYEVGRRLHEVHIVRGLQRGLEVLRRHQGLVEQIGPLTKGDANPDPATADRAKVRFRLHGEEDGAARLVHELVMADVGVASIARVRSDLEDVYQSVGRDEVS